MQQPVDDTFAGPLKPSDGPTITVNVPSDKIYESHFSLQVAFDQKELGPFSYSIQIIGPTQLAEDFYLAKNRVVHPKDNPTVLPLLDVDIFCGTFYEVRVEGIDNLGVGVQNHVFRSPSCTNTSMAACSVSNLVLVTDANGDRHLRFSVAGAERANGCTWKVEVKHGSQPIESDFFLMESDDVYEDQIIDLPQLMLPRGVTWFRVAAFDHTPLRRSIPLQNAFSFP